MKINKSLRVGVVVIGAFVLLYFGGLYLRGLPYFSKNRSYYIRYDDVDGLQTSNPILLNGYVVGNVRRIELDYTGYSVLVSISIKKELVLYDGVVAELENSSFLGGKSINLLMDSVSNQVLAPGDTLDSRVKSNMLDALDESKLGEDIAYSVAGIRDILTDMEGGGAIIINTLENFNKLSGSLVDFFDENSHKINYAFTKVDSILYQLHTFSKQLNTTTQLLHDKIDTVDIHALNSLLRSLDDTSREVAKLVSGLDEGNGTIGKLLRDDSLYVHLDNTILSLGTILTGLEEDPNRYLAPLGRTKEQILRRNRRLERRRRKGGE